ncbi:MAG: hypothetical protein IJ837_02080 [Clostridia bacterium]|nr:hypothetical protein [Clostridia bacterium]
MTKFNNKLIVVCCVFAIFSFFSGFYKPIVFADSEETQEIIYDSVTTSIDYKNNELYLTDSANKKIIIKNLKDNSAQETLTTNEPNLVFFDYQNTVYHTESGTFGLYVNQTLLNQINTFSVSNILDICCDIQNNIYVICKDANETPLVLVKKNDVMAFEIFCKLDGLTLNQNSKLTSSLENGFLILYTNSSFYKVKQNNFSLLSNEDYKLPTLTNVLDIKLDFYDNLYILGDNKLFKCNKNSYETLENSVFSNSKEFELDYLTGDIILRTETNVIKLKNTNFVVTMASTTPNYKSEIYDCSIIKTTEKTYLFEFDNSLYKKEINNEAIELPENTNLVMLTKTKNNFYYVLINNMSNQNITGYIKASSAEIVNQNEEEKTIRIINSTTPLYLYPTSLDESLTLKDEDNNIKYLNKIILTMTIENFGTTDTNGLSFSKVLYKDKYYYINSNNFVLAEKTSIQPVFEQLKENTTVYSDQNFNNIIKELSKGTNINILEKGQNYAKISWGTTEVGYIKYEQAQEIHLTTWQLLAIILLTIIAIALVVFMTVAILKHKQKQKTKNF